MNVRIYNGNTHIILKCTEKTEHQGQISVRLVHMPVFQIVHIEAGHHVPYAKADQLIQHQFQMPDGRDAWYGNDCLPGKVMRSTWRGHQTFAWLLPSND